MNEYGLDAYVEETVTVLHSVNLLVSLLCCHSLYGFLPGKGENSLQTS